MQRSTEALRVALRVLTAVSEGQAPDTADTEKLKSYAPSLALGPTDELACDVIVQQIKKRAEVRARAGGGGMSQ